MAVGQGTGSPGSTSLFRQNIQGGDQNAAGLSSSRSGDAGSGSTSLPSFSFGLGGIESPLRAGESRVLPPPTWQGHSYEPTPPPLGSPGPSSHFPPFSLPPLPPPPQHHDPSSSSSSSRTFVVGNGYSPFPHPYQTNRQPPFFPPTNSPLQRHQQFGGVASEPWSNPSPSIYQPFPPFQLPPEPVPTPSPSVSASMSAPESTFLSPAAGEERGGGGATTRTSSVTGPSLEELLEDRHEGVSSLEGILNGAVPGGLGVEMEVGDHGVAMAGGEDLFLLQLLWPACVPFFPRLSLFRNSCLPLCSLPTDGPHTYRVLESSSISSRRSSPLFPSPTSSSTSLDSSLVSLSLPSTRTSREPSPSQVSRLASVLTFATPSFFAQVIPVSLSFFALARRVFLS